MFKIPKIIHQTWKSDKIPDQFKLINNKLLELHPDYEYKLWTDNDNYKFIKNEYPFLLELYESYPKNIQKVDLVRYCILHKYGGIFLDLDFLIIRNFDSLINNKQCVFGLEPNNNTKNWNKDKIICNAWMASIPNHPFFRHIIDNSQNKKLDLNDVLSSTGPFFLTNCYDNYIDQYKITLLESFYLYPLNYEEIDYYAKKYKNHWSKNKGNNLLSKIKFSFAIHLFEGSWWSDVKQTTNSNHFLNFITEKCENVIDYPLISCLCITQNIHIERAIECFLSQNYPNSELIIIYENDNRFIEKINNYKSIHNIKLYEIPINPKLTLGDLRNISLDCSNGEYVIQWDDDDFYFPNRIIEQYKRLHTGTHLKKCNLLDSVLSYSYSDNKMYLPKGYYGGFQGSILCKKDHMDKYVGVNLAEDEIVLNKFRTNKFSRKLVYLNNPYLYIYTYHGNNSWDEDHFNKIISNGTVIENDYYKNMLLNYYK